MTSEATEFAAIGAAIDRACEKLPEGYLLSLSLERGSAMVSVTDPHGEDLDLHEYPDDPLDEMIDNALADALSRASESAE